MGSDKDSDDEVVGQTGEQDDVLVDENGVAETAEEVCILGLNID